MELVKRGDRVSLNTRKRIIYTQGDGGINLTMSGNKTIIIPESISDNFLGKINVGVQLGYLVRGWPPGEKIVIPEDDNFDDILKKGRNKIKDFIYEIKINKGLNNEKKITKLEKLLKLEKEGKNRVSVTSEIERTLSTIAGISHIVEEEKKEKIEIKLVKGTEE